MNKNKVVILLLAVSAISLLMFLFIQTNSRSFTITDSAPSQDESNVAIDSTIEIYFSKNIERVGLSSINDPSVDYSEYEMRIETRPTIVADVSIDGGTLRINPRHTLLENQEYDIFLSNITSDDEEMVDQYGLSFTTGQDESARAQFIRSLPLYQTNYNVTYSSTRNAFTVQVTGGDVESVTESAYELLRENAIDVDNETIIIETLRTEQGGGSPAG